MWSNPTTGEVVARVQAVLRRSRKDDAREDILRWQGLEVDVAAIVATVSHSGNLRLFST